MCFGTEIDVLDSKASQPDAAFMQTLTLKIDALLPQTQCTQCGYQGCMPYAEAIATGEAPINRCPPGGDAGIHALAALLDRPLMALDADCGAHLPHRVAMIIEAECIGCAKCLKACPTDAIVGANKFMHSVIAELCTGCELCIAPCPVDCITMVPVTPARGWNDADVLLARTRYYARNERLAHDKREREARLAAKSTSSAPAAGTAVSEAAAKKKAEGEVTVAQN